MTHNRNGNIHVSLTDISQNIKLTQWFKFSRLGPSSIISLVKSVKVVFYFDESQNRCRFSIGYLESIHDLISSIGSVYPSCKHYIMAVLRALFLNHGLFLFNFGKSRLSIYVNFTYHWTCCYVTLQPIPQAASAELSKVNTHLSYLTRTFTVMRSHGTDLQTVSHSWLCSTSILLPSTAT